MSSSLINLLRSSTQAAVASLRHVVPLGRRITFYPLLVGRRPAPRTDVCFSPRHTAAWTPRSEQQPARHWTIQTDHSAYLALPSSILVSFMYFFLFRHLTRRYVLPSGNPACAASGGLAGDHGGECPHLSSGSLECAALCNLTDPEQKYFCVNGPLLKLFFRRRRSL